MADRSWIWVVLLAALLAPLALPGGNAILVVLLSAAFLALSVALHRMDASGRGPGLGTGRTGSSKQAIGSAAPRADTRNAVLVAFLVRLGFGFAILLFGFENTLAPDSAEYARNGQILAMFWSGEGFYPTAQIMAAGNGRYVALNAVGFWLVGQGAPYLMVALTAATGAWTVHLAGRIARAIAGPQAVSKVVWLTALFPSLIIWSSLNLRDPYMILAVTGSAWATIQIQQGKFATGSLQLLAWLSLIGLFRDYLFAIVVTGVIAAFIVGSGRQMARNVVGGAIAVALVFLLGDQAGFGESALDRTSLEQVVELRQQFASGANSAYLQDVDLSSPEAVGAFIPIALLYFLFSPFPWAISGTMQLVTLPDVLLLYWLVPKMWHGVWWLLRQQRYEVFAIVSIAAVIALSYALVSGNIGTAYRHRAQVVPLLAILGGIGLSSRAMAPSINRSPRRHALWPAPIRR